MVIITIGVGIVMMGAGLFIGKYLAETDYFKKKQEEHAFRKEMRRIAKEQAMQEAMPALIKKYKEDEIKKVTGEYGKERLKKFADNFSMGGSNNNMFNPEKILGKQSANGGGVGNDYFNPEKILGTRTNNQTTKNEKKKKETPEVNEEQERVYRMLGLRR